MKKEFWRKAPQCSSCVYHRPEGKRPHSVDPDTIWKESCFICGFSFWPELEEAEICFDYASQRKDSAMVDKAEKDRWAKKHICSRCAFYETNGFEYFDHPEIGKYEAWNADFRCRGYIHIIDNDHNCFCSSFLSLEQWAEVESTPIYEGQRIRKWEEFRRVNSLCAMHEMK